MLFSLAARNLMRNRRRTLITMSAIALGMAMMDVTICLQHGTYQDTIRRGVGSLAGHVVVQAPGYQETKDGDIVVRNSSDIVETLRQLTPDALIVRRTFLGGLLNSTSGSAAVGVSAVEPGNSQLLGAMDEYLIDGEWLQSDRDIIVGKRLAETLHVQLGDKVVFMAQVDSEMTSRLFRVKGIYRTGADDQDGFLVVIRLDAAQAVTERPDAATQVTVHLARADDWPQAVSAASAALADQDVEVLSWKQALPDVDAFIQADRSIGQGMLTVLGIIVAMGVFNTFLMSVLERTREFGVLQAIGMKPRYIAQLVLAEGAVLGAVSITLGTALGAALTWPMIEYGLDFSDSLGESYTNGGVLASSVIHSAYNWPRMLVFGVGGFFLTVATAIWPAWRVSQLEPVEALRHQQ